MSTQVRDGELFGVTESSVTLSFVVADDAGPVDAEARVLLDGEERATSSGVAGTRLVRLDGLEPKREYRVSVEVAGGAPLVHDAYLPETFQTLPGTDAHEVASFATLNDLHFGEPRFGATGIDGEETLDAGDPKQVANETDTDVPYWKLMNEDAVADINRESVDFAVIKGDIADAGREDQFRVAADTFAGFRMPHHAFLGNHDHYGLLEGAEVDGYALLDQPPAPRAVDTGGWRLLLVDTVEPGEHHGVFPQERVDWLRDALDEASGDDVPTLILTHHQPTLPEFADKGPNRIAILPEHSLRMFDLIAGYSNVKGVLIGHTHQNRVRRYRQCPGIPYIEVHCVKDYPGGWAHYRLFDDGHFRQEVRRTPSERALEHSTRCRDFFRGRYRDFSLGTLDARSFVSAS